MTVNQIMTGLTGYIDAEILPHLSGAKRYGATVYLALVELNAMNWIKDALNHPAVRMLGVVDGENVDADKLHTAMSKAMHGESLKIDIPIIGTFSFNTSDVDKLFDYMRRAS